MYVPLLLIVITVSVYSNNPTGPLNICPRSPHRQVLCSTTGLCLAFIHQLPKQKKNSNTDTLKHFNGRMVITCDKSNQITVKIIQVSQLTEWYKNCIFCKLIDTCTKVHVLFLYHYALTDSYQHSIFSP